ncbi:MAG: dihydropteroate synthase [Alphaproteobacteria bacterium]
MADRTGPKIVGIVNITADSFSDGGLYRDPEKAIQHALQLRADGADVIDLGAASSHPDAEDVPAREEIERLEPVIDELKRRGLTLSVDSYHPETQLYALQHGAAYLNDIHGFVHREIYKELGRSGCRLIVMHAIQGAGRATRETSDPAGIRDRIEGFFAKRMASLCAAGVAREQLIIDPGMGFFLGVDPEVSLTTLRELAWLKRRFGVPVLVSVSRKSFLRALTGRAVTEVGAATLAAELYAATQGVDYIRTHDARALRDGLCIWRALSEEDATSALGGGVTPVTSQDRSRR